MFGFVLNNFYNLPSLGEVSPIQGITLLGIVLTIIISISSLNLQWHATARESIEQLDDLELYRQRYKIKPILHSFPTWPFRNTKVKFQVYQPTDVAGVSGLHPNFMALPGYLFENYSVEPVPDGYVMTIKSRNAVQIRRVTNRLLRELSEGSNQGRINQFAPFEIFEKEYEAALKGVYCQIHYDVISVLEETAPLNVNDIRNSIREELDHSSRYTELAVQDLEAWGAIEEVDSTGGYRVVD